MVGIARDSKYDEATEDPRPFLYVSLAQHTLLDRETVLVRTAAAPDLIAPSVHAAIRALDPTPPIFDARTFDTLLKNRVDKRRGISGLFAMFGLLALLLAVLGVYSVMAYSVARRTREMGVRLALGRMMPNRLKPPVMIRDRPISKCPRPPTPIAARSRDPSEPLAVLAAAPR